MKKVFFSLVGEREKEGREKEERRREREEGGRKKRGGKWEERGGKNNHLSSLAQKKKWIVPFGIIPLLIPYTYFESFSHNKKREREREDGG